jgi:hypothetical protein
MNRDHPTQPEYQARVQEVLDRPELYGLTPEEAEAQAEADMKAEDYADRWQAWAESQEPEREPEAGLDDAEVTANAAQAEADLEPEAELGVW